MDGHRPSTYGDSFADVYDSWYSEVSDAETTADLVNTAAPAGTILELGVGTGRLALPLLTKGRRVVGIDSSMAMLDKCPPAEGLRLVAGDMSSLPFAGPFAGVLCAFNTLFNLIDPDHQGRVFLEAAQRLVPKGILVVEAITGLDLDSGPRSSVGVSQMSVTDLVLSATLLDAKTQTISGQHIQIEASGVKLRPWALRWSTPDQLDEMAQAAGLTLDSRYSDWDRSPFTTASTKHVSVYRLV